jgi:hypothetical protein
MEGVRDEGMSAWYWGLSMARHIDRDVLHAK